jgi:methylenetetrahydrofolate dehydrogenase (NADP+)/methenyltetrahydrofolate cyclohydrolase
MVIDGTTLAKDIKNQLRSELATWPHQPTLGFVRSGDDLVAKKFVGMKAKTAAELGISVVEVLLPSDADTEAAVAAVREVASKTDGVIVQMPLPAGRQGLPDIDSGAVIAAIPLNKDVDAMGARSGKLVLTPVVGAIAHILEVYKGQSFVKDKKVVVVGQGKLVGAPAAAWFRAQGAEVSVLARGDDLGLLTFADIVVLGAGVPGMITPEMLKPGVVLLDAGTSEAGGTLKGDADPSCAEVASLCTPVPGGIGPVAVAMIFKNLLVLAGKK